MESITKFLIKNYHIVSCIFLGNNLKITFQNKADIHELKVLELKGIVGYIETFFTYKNLAILRVDNVGGSYTTDLSMRLHKPHIEKFPEAFIFIDDGCTDFCFRAVAETIEFREWEKGDSWLP